MVAARKLDDELEVLDVELDGLPADLQWREWMNRIEAVIFASASVVPRDMLQKVVGRSANIDLLIEDIQADLKGKPYEVVSTTGGWMFRTRAHYATAIRTAADISTTLPKKKWPCSALSLTTSPSTGQGSPTSLARKSTAICSDGCVTRT